MAKEPKSTPDYEVGWGKPPQHTHFKKGQSGNPKGRPAGTRNLKTDLATELGRRIRVREGDREASISKQEAFVKSLVARALKGDARASALLINLMAKLLDVVSAPAPIEVGANEQAIIEAYYRRRFAEAAIPTANGATSEGAPSINPQNESDSSAAAGPDSETQNQPFSSNTDSQKV